MNLCENPDCIRKDQPLEKRKVHGHGLCGGCYKRWDRNKNLSDPKSGSGGPINAPDWFWQNLGASAELRKELKQLCKRRIFFWKNLQINGLEGAKLPLIVLTENGKAYIKFNRGSELDEKCSKAYFKSNSDSILYGMLDVQKLGLLLDGVGMETVLSHTIWRKHDAKRFETRRDFLELKPIKPKRKRYRRKV